MEIRKIVHIDMDAFYASVEQRDDPQLRGRRRCRLVIIPAFGGGTTLVYILKDPPSSFVCFLGKVHRAQCGLTGC